MKLSVKNKTIRKIPQVHTFGFSAQVPSMLSPSLPNTTVGKICWVSILEKQDEDVLFESKTGRCVACCAPLGALQ